MTFHSLLRAPRLVILSQTTYTKFSHHGNTKTTYDMIVTNIKSDIVFCEVAVMVTFSSLSHEQPRSRWDIFSRTCHPVISNVACTTSSRYDHSELSWLLEKKTAPAPQLILFSCRKQITYQHKKLMASRPRMPLMPSRSFNYCEPFKSDYFLYSCAPVDYILTDTAW